LIGVLATAPSLPLSGDVYGVMPGDTPVQILTHGRRVPGHNLWLWYWGSDQELKLVGLSIVPPGA
jgi:hypothetical protein